ncbi:MAG: adenine deaminase [Spirochaetes bacterium GWD1_61_31]|nr:MAG: adenine deaminase [Spirochaetes bacterium GWB1_60_80]OHD32317.1 MAG: adenine deaminase [Spirochaetes bacterium GWC1_61_12]OHD40561.1 MAG: adenine deaminase [Spirochaetes bacterium GWD1_61_31]OHD44063.1 MAG: adenine deaminase [Spirochaetes bacterium GWE1_60_18]OHD59096.1 MAG: adenine deaminase [Spirochaetes bacterium GWF1_60_12]
MTQQREVVTLKYEYIAAARGQVPVDLQLVNCRVVDFFRGRVVDNCSVSIYKGYIVGVGEELPARQILDLAGCHVCPGLVDAHVHIESSLLAPAEFARLVTPRGTTSVIADPHEIANVLGYDGINWMLRASEGLPLDVYIMAPSCVPATDFDTAGAALYASDLAPFLREARVLGLGEMMNYPGVLNGDPRVLDKLSLFWEAGRPIDGHAPGLSGRDLSAYVLSGIRSDHEATSPAEALEKISKGMWVMARFGSGARDLEHLIPAMEGEARHRMLLCTDDRHPNDIVAEGHIDAALRILLANGIPLVDALRMACYNPAQYYGLRRSGAIAPGYKADLLAFGDPADFQAELVLKAGVVVARGGKPSAEWDGFRSDDRRTPAVRDSVNVKWLEAAAFRIPDEGGRVRVIEATPGSIITAQSRERPTVVDGLCVSDVARDLIKLFVIERHTGSGLVGKAFIRGLKLKRGAIGSTVSHDSHNMIVAGADDVSIFKAVKRLNAIKGGFVITDGEEIIAELALPVGGLMSDRPAAEVLEKLAQFSQYFEREAMPGGSPLMTLSFMALPVIPSLKITDKGLVDVDSFSAVPLFE